MLRSMSIKSLSLILVTLALVTNAESATITSSFSTSSTHSPFSQFNGYVIGIGASENGTAIGTAGQFSRFDESLGMLTGVSLSYQYSETGLQRAGAFSNRRVSGYTARSGHRVTVNSGFAGTTLGIQVQDDIFIEQGNQQGAFTSGNRVPWNTTQLWNGYWVHDMLSQSSGVKTYTEEFNESSFSDFISKSYLLRLDASVIGSSITGCNSLSTCGADFSTTAFLTNATLTYTYTEVSAVPVPAAVWLFGSGLLGLVGFARRKK